MELDWGYTIAATVRARLTGTKTPRARVDSRSPRFGRGPAGSAPTGCDLEKGLRCYESKLVEDIVIRRWDCLNAVSPPASISILNNQEGGFR